MKTTKTERRIIAEEARRKTPMTSLADYLHLKSLLKATRTGSKACACGATISANKPGCLACSLKPEGTTSDIPTYANQPAETVAQEQSA